MVGQRPASTIIRRFFPSADQVAADEERKEAALDTDVIPIAEAQPRQRANLSGVVRSVVLRPHGGTAALEVELYDGSGAIDLIWLGRRRISGIEPGARLKVHGLVVTTNGRQVLYNPRYALKPKPGE